MGRPKLLLPLGETTVIARLLDTLRHPQVHCQAVVLRQSDQDLLKEVESQGAWAIQPEHDPPEMRESVQSALHAIEEKFAPDDQDAWLLVPADHPVLSVSMIEILIAAWQKSSAEILVPTCDNRRGHPSIFSWKLARRVPDIPRDRGLNWLVRFEDTVIEEIPVTDTAIFTDLDTPADYEALKQWFS